MSHLTTDNILTILAGIGALFVSAVLWLAKHGHISLDDDIIVIPKRTKHKHRVTKRHTEIKAVKLETAITKGQSLWQRYQTWNEERERKERERKARLLYGDP